MMHTFYERQLRSHQSFGAYDWYGSGRARCTFKLGGYELSFDLTIFGAVMQARQSRPLRVLLTDRFGRPELRAAFAADNPRIR